MALFNGVDRNLPLLTQTLQLDRESRDELLAFVAAQLRGVSPSELELESTDYLSEVVGVSQALINDLFRCGSMCAETLEDFLLLYNEMPRTTFHVKTGTGALVTPLDIMGAMQETPSGLVANRILSGVFDEIHEHGGKNLRRCAECASVFVRSRGAHIYCSYRCAHRVGERRRRKEKHEEESDSITINKCHVEV